MLQLRRVLRIVYIADGIDFVTVHRINGKLASIAEHGTTSDILPVITKVSAAQYGDNSLVALGGCVCCFPNCACIENGWITASRDERSECIAFKHLFPLRGWWGWCGLTSLALLQLGKYECAQAN